MTLAPARHKAIADAISPARRQARKIARYAPLITIDPGDARGSYSAERAECPTCLKTVAGGSIVTDPGDPIPHQAFPGATVLRRRFICDHCNHMIAVYQQAVRLPDGVLEFGDVLDHDIIATPRLIDQFLAQHPQAAGILQA